MTGYPQAPPIRRPVVSFVRRSTRMRPQQRRAYDDLGDRFLLDVPRDDLRTSLAPGLTWDARAVFGRDAGLIVEIGPGTGESLVPMAAAHPEANVLAFEVYQPGVARILTALRAESVDNVRIVEADAVDGFRHLLPPNSVAEVWLFFPDPWHKARHHKRRILTPRFADLVASQMLSGGLWRLATDWKDYATQMRDVLDTHLSFDNEYSGRAPRWAARPVTRFERRGRDAGRRIFDLVYRRR